MANDVWLKQLFHSIDRRDADAFVGFLTEDVHFRFGNAEPVNGKAAVRDAVCGFFASIRALHHDVVGTVEQGDIVVCHGAVMYTRHDSSTLTVPFANILRLRGDSIMEYLVHMDISDL